MEDFATENLILIDWVSITSKIHSVMDWHSDLGMTRCAWTDGTGARGYKHRDYFEGVSIMHETSSEWMTWLEMSGSGCRTFESVGSGQFDYLFSLVRNNPGDMHLTRLDIAFDDHTGVLDIDRIYDDVCNQNYVSRSREWECVISSKGKCCYIGSPTSDIRIRIYDKAAERGFTDGRHWVRVEVQLRDKLALSFASKPLDMSLSERFLSTLSNYLRFVVPDPDDTNKSRWPLTPYWEDLIGAARAVRLYSKPGRSYNLGAAQGYVLKQPVNAIRSMLKCYGPERFVELVNEAPVVFSQKYQQVVEGYFTPTRLKPGRRYAPIGSRFTVKQVDAHAPYYCRFCDSTKEFGEFAVVHGSEGAVCRSCYRLGKHRKAIGI